MDLWKGLKDGLSHIGLLTYGRATGGSATTVIDTNRPEEDEPEDFEDGTLIVLRDSAGAGAAPEGEFSRIVSYAPGTNTFTVADTLTAAVASGDRYGVTSNIVHHDEILEMANDALRQLGDVPFMDTSITTAASQTEYTLPVALKEYAPRRISVQGITTDANDNRWIDIDNWDYTFTNAGSTALLILPQLPQDRTVRVMYLGQHPAVNAFSDDISEYIHPVLFRASFVERLANRLVGTTQHSVPSTRIGYDKAIEEFEKALTKYPINKPSKHSRYTSIEGNDWYEFVPNVARL